jgi:hypothetical protein
MAGTRPRSGAGRAFDVGLSLYGAAVFTVLWGGLLVAVATGGTLLEDAWAWLTGLDTVGAVVAWILLLPIAVGLWAWNEAGSLLVQGVVLVGLTAWTVLVVRGLARTFGRHAERS